MSRIDDGLYALSVLDRISDRVFGLWMLTRSVDLSGSTDPGRSRDLADAHEIVLDRARAVAYPRRPGLRIDYLNSSQETDMPETSQWLDRVRCRLLMAERYWVQRCGCRDRKHWLHHSDGDARDAYATAHNLVTRRYCVAQHPRSTCLRIDYLD